MVNKEIHQHVGEEPFVYVSFSRCQLPVLAIGNRRLVIISQQRRPDRTVGEEPFVYVSFSGCQLPMTIGFPTIDYKHVVVGQPGG